MLNIRKITENAQDKERMLEKMTAGEKALGDSFSHGSRNTTKMPDGSAWK